MRKKEYKLKEKSRRLNPFPKDKKKIYGIIVDLEENISKKSKSYTIRLDLLNDEMINYDQKYIYTEEDNPYEPGYKAEDYLYFYFAELTVTEKNYNVFLKIKKKELSMNMNSSQ